QSCFFRNIGLNLLTKPNQFADLANLFFEWQLRELFSHFGLHGFGSFKLCRRKISANSVLSILACDMSCSMRAKSLCRPTIAARAPPSAQSLIKPADTSSFAARRTSARGIAGDSSAILFGCR